MTIENCFPGAPRWLSYASDFSSCHDLTIREFKPHIQFCADSSEPGTFFRSCVSFSICPFPAHGLSLKNK